MSLKPVISRNCSSSGMTATRWLSIYLRKACADSAVIAPDATASSSSCWLYILFLPFRVGGTPGVLSCQYTRTDQLAADHPLTVHGAADQCSADRAEYRAGRSSAMRIDRTTDQRSAGGADDQAGGPV